MREEGFIVSAGPHIQTQESIQKMMYGFILALLPATIMGVYYFGKRAIIIILASVISAVVFDAILGRLIQKRDTVRDGDAIFTGLVLALIMPITTPWWAIIIGVFIALLVGKHVYGGLGSNPFNPPLIGWAALQLSFPSHLDISGSVLGVVKLEGISALVEDYSYFSENYGIESLSGLGAKVKVFIKALLGWKAVPGSDQLVGCVGQLCALAIIIGAVYLLWKKYISWHIPVSFLVTIVIFSLIFYKGDRAYLYPFILVQLLAGGSLIAAFFVAAEPVTSPLTSVGMIIFGCGAALITMIGRFWGKWVDPVWFGLLVMNCFTPLIDRIFKPKPFGRVKSSA